MALLLAGYSEQSFILSAFRKLNKHKYKDVIGKLPDTLVPKMGLCSQINFWWIRCLKCCNTKLALQIIYKKTSEELEEELDIVYLLKSLRKVNELIKDDDDEESKANSTPQITIS
jgi:hypothetical protein